MRKMLNTLYVSTQGSYLRKEGETLVVEQATKKVLQLPIHGLGGLVCFGNVLCSPFLLGFCAEKDVSVSFLTEYGRFLASVRGPVSGNVLLRREQYRKADDPMATREIAANVVSAKIANSRITVNRTARDHKEKVDGTALKAASSRMAAFFHQIDKATTTDEIRGIEGIAAAHYFSVFNHLIIDQKETFVFRERNRRPPLDEVNALLSFTYTLLAHDVRSALETVGLDPSVGFLHRDRPGRPGLALDLMEEFRPVIADRLVLSLINRRQIGKSGFKIAENGAVVMDDDTRKTLLTEYQTRKQREVFHPYIEESIPIGLLFFVQANLLARYIRGDIDGYPPFFWR
ncbi:type I-C CRISPR-associated endonuclease Cas1 [Alkalispirochaeta sphaeroplastigenens]|uniref:CRISPR-associated endonuclease Cas1 n=1 Tax=Alkalispirochaeta sphaeroplastigenens TaxID=1187066 RepID=A0A2S4JGW3_9SPIO|nr:type I-C CRISPR-associated endonuclease Cas1c [Alkalispirochaeta sphaeroplastigenens]POQ98709.1 type I-C CRISPR-associated endonuclease Cas1 [Alkalispirochaeta sphaeroplastigenens]